MKIYNILKFTIVAASILFIAVATLGTLAAPAVLAYVASWYWLFLYAGYMLIIIGVIIVYFKFGVNGVHGCYGGKRK